MTEKRYIKLLLWSVGLGEMEKCEKAADALIAKGFRKQSEDMVEVVRCKDCKNRYVPSECALWYGTVGDKEYFCERGDNFFCSYGERKE